MDFKLTEEQLRLQGVARRFAYEEIQPIARQLDRAVNPEDAYPVELVRRASALGLRTLKIPRRYGGAEADSLTEAIVLEELCVGDVGFGTLIAHPWREGWAIATLASDEQRARFLPAFLDDDSYVTALGITEPHSGSDGTTPFAGNLEAGPQTRAVLQGGDWVLNGKKQFITAGNVAKLIIVVARTDATVAWPHGISLFLVPADAPGFRCVRVQDKLGIRVNPNTELIFENCRIPAANLLGGVNQGVELLRRLGAGSKAKEGVKSLGIARAAYEAAAEWAERRVQGGKSLIEHQVVAHELASMATRIEIARTFLWRAAWSVDHRPEDAPRLEAMAKVFTTRMAAEVAVEALEIFGGYGILRDHPIEKLVRDATSMLHAFVGNSAMQENLAALLGRERAAARPTRGHAASHV